MTEFSETSLLKMEGKRLAGDSWQRATENMLYSLHLRNLLSATLTMDK